MGVGLATPMDENGVWMTEVETAGRESTPDGSSWVFADSVSPWWFEESGTDIIAGRDSSESDGRSSPLVAVVNETIANSLSKAKTRWGISSVRLR
jgi:hypothetical protein